jgi:hypothetical protein
MREYMRLFEFRVLQTCLIISNNILLARIYFIMHQTISSNHYGGLRRPRTTEIYHALPYLLLLKKRLLQTSVGLLPFAEQTVRESKSARGVYQFSTLISQIREIMGDIEADRDRDLLLTVIDERVIKPAFMDMAHEIVMKHFEFRKNLEQAVRPDEVQRFNLQFKRLARELATDMQGHYFKIREGLDKALKN